MTTASKAGHFPSTLTGADSARIEAALRAARSPQTRRAYASQWAAWGAWCASRGACPLPAAPVELAAYLAERAQIDRAIAGVLFHAGLRRSEAAELRWGDVEPAASIPGALTIRVRTSKTNRDGEATDVRLAKNGAAAALTALRPANAAPEALVFRGLNGQSIGRRFAAAAKSAGIEGVTAHSGRVGLASELTAAGASTTETMLAGGWKTARMVAHYSAGASAERGAVAKYL